MRDKITQFIAYGAAGASPGLINFILIPIFVRLLTIDEFGLLETFSITALLLNYVLTLGFKSSLLNCYHRDFHTDEERHSLISTSFAFIGLTSLTLIITLSLTCGLWWRFLPIPQEYINFFQITLIWTFGQNLLTIILAVYRTKDRALTYLLISMCYSIGILLLNLLFLLKWRWSLWGILAAYCMAAGLAVILGLLLLDQKLTWRISRPQLKKLLRFGLPLIPASMAIWVVGMSNRYLLGYLSGLQAVGLYSLGYKLSMISFLLVVMPFNMFWPTYMYELAAREDANQCFARAFSIYCCLAMPVVVGISALSPELIRLLAPPKFLPSQKIVIWLCLTFFLDGAAALVISGLHLGRKIRIYPWIIGSMALLNILLTLALIPPYGIVGAAIGTFVSYVGIFLGVYFFSQRAYHIKFPIIKLPHALAVGLLVYLVVHPINLSSLVLAFTLKMALVLFLLPLAFLLSGYFSRAELQEIISYKRDLGSLSHLFMGK